VRLGKSLENPICYFIADLQPLAAAVARVPKICGFVDAGHHGLNRPLA
jgi:hypothetical protein